MKDVLFLSPKKSNVPVSPEDNDLLFADGDVVMVDGSKRKFQDIAKILLTRIGSDPIFPTYGSDIPNVSGERAELVEGRVSDSVLEALSFLIEVEKSTAPNENIKSIKSLSVSTPASEPRQLDVLLSVILTDGSVVQTSVRV